MAGQPARCHARGGPPRACRRGAGGSRGSGSSSPSPMRSWPPRSATVSAPSCTLVDLSGSSTYPIPSLQVVAKLELAQLYVATGHIEDALSEFDGAETFARALLRPTMANPADPTGPAPASWLLSSLARVGVALSLATDNLDAAAEWSKTVADPFWGPMCEAKVRLVRGDDRGGRGGTDQGRAEVRPPRGGAPPRVRTGDGWTRPAARHRERGRGSPYGGRARAAADGRFGGDGGSRAHRAVGLARARRLDGAPATLPRAHLGATRRRARRTPHRSANATSYDCCRAA